MNPAFPEPVIHTWIYTDAAHLENASTSDFNIATDCAVLIINYNTARQTRRCLQSLLDAELLPAQIHLLDNHSAEEDFNYLKIEMPARPVDIRLYLYRAEDNLGFAAGSNALLEQALRHPEIRYVLLLNNDAVAHPALLKTLRQALIDGEAENIHMAGASMHRLDRPEEADTLGIALYTSLMPADRKTFDDHHVGPTGGCALYTRNLLDTLKNTSGYWFDPRFFCYSEDTDLVLRARLLGFRATHIHQVLALHEGQASSGGSYNDFIVYHGLRNTIWMHIKLIPANLLYRYGIFLLAAHLASILRYILTGRLSLLTKVYRDAWQQRQPFLEERKQWTKKAHASKQLQACITPRFYRRGYLRQILRKTR